MIQSCSIMGTCNCNSSLIEETSHYLISWYLLKALHSSSRHIQWFYVLCTIHMLHSSLGFPMSTCPVTLHAFKCLMKIAFLFKINFSDSQCYPSFTYMRILRNKEIMWVWIPNWWDARSINSWVNFFKVDRKAITSTFQSHTHTRVLYFYNPNHGCSMKGERLFL